MRGAWHRLSGGERVIAQPSVHEKPPGRSFFLSLLLSPFPGHAVLGDVSLLFAFSLPLFFSFIRLRTVHALGSRHRSRWQDVENLLAAESSDLHHPCRGPVFSGRRSGRSPAPHPGRVCPFRRRAAGDVEPVDVAPEVLRDRLARGHICPAEQAEMSMWAGSRRVTCRRCGNWPCCGWPPRWPMPAAAASRSRRLPAAGYGSGCSRSSVARRAMLHRHPVPPGHGGHLQAVHAAQSAARPAPAVPARRSVAASPSPLLHVPSRRTGHTCALRLRHAPIATQLYWRHPPHLAGRAAARLASDRRSSATAAVSMCHRHLHAHRLRRPGHGM